MIDTETLNPPLDEYRRQFEALQEDVRYLVEGLSRAQFNWSPAPDKWSIAQCLGHLREVDDAYAEKLDEGISRARDKGLVGGGRLRYGPFERWFIRTLEPPIRRRFKAPGSVAPASDYDFDLVDRLLASQDRIRELLERANGLDVSRARITSPISSLLKLRLGAAFALLVAHDRRHLWQARQVRQHPDFPEDIPEQLMGFPEEG